MYRKFWLATQGYDSPIRFGYDWFCSAIDKIYESKDIKVDWLDYELMVRDILKSQHLTDLQKVSCMSDAISAYTKR